MNVSRAIFRRNRPLTTQSRAVARFLRRGDASLTLPVRAPITNKTGVHCDWFERPTADDPIVDPAPGADDARHDVELRLGRRPDRHVAFPGRRREDEGRTLR